MFLQDGEARAQTGTEGRPFKDAVGRWASTSQKVDNQGFGETTPTDPLILNFQPLELQGNKLLWFESLVCGFRSQCKLQVAEDVESGGSCESAAAKAHTAMARSSGPGKASGPATKMASTTEGGSRRGVRMPDSQIE